MKYTRNITLTDILCENAALLRCLDPVFADGGQPTYAIVSVDKTFLYPNTCSFSVALSTIGHQGTFAVSGNVSGGGATVVDGGPTGFAGTVPEFFNIDFFQNELSQIVSFAEGFHPEDTLGSVFLRTDLKVQKGRKISSRSGCPFTLEVTVPLVRDWKIIVKGDFTLQGVVGQTLYLLNMKTQDVLEPQRTAQGRVSLHNAYKKVSIL